MRPWTCRSGNRDAQKASPSSLMSAFFFPKDDGQIRRMSTEYVLVSDQGHALYFYMIRKENNLEDWN